MDSKRKADLKWLSYQVLPIIVCIFAGLAIALYYDSSLLSLALMFALAIAVFVKLPYALYALLLFLPFSFRYILPMQAEVQMPTEPLLGMMALAYGLRWIIRTCMSEKTVCNVENGDSPSGSISDRRFPFALPLLAYGTSHVLSLINAPSLYLSGKGIVRALAYIMLAFIVYDVARSKRELRYLFIASFPSAAVAVLWTTLVLIGNLQLWQWRSAYSGTPFTNYSVYGSFAGVFFLILLSRLLLDKEPYDKVMWGGFLLIFSIGLAFCFSRGAWLSIIIAMLFLFSTRTEGNQYRKFLTIVAFGFVFLVILSIPGVFNLLIERVETVFSTRFASNKMRLLRWAAAIRMFLQQPITGTGYGSFGLLYQGKVELVGEIAKYQLGAHNEYLQTLAEMGILGFASWIYLIVAFFAYGIRQLRQIENTFYRSIVIGLMTAELSLLVHLFVVSILHVDRTGIPFWCIYGLLPAVCQMSRTHRAENG